VKRFEVVPVKGSDRVSWQISRGRHLNSSLWPWMVKSVYERVGFEKGIRFSSLIPEDYAFRRCGYVEKCPIVPQDNKTGKVDVSEGGSKSRGM